MIKYFGTNLKVFYGSNLILFDETKGKYKGKITHDVPISNMENALRIISDEMRGFFVTRQMYQMPLITTISLTGYPKLREIFGDYFRKNNIEIEEIKGYGQFSGHILLVR